MGLIAIGDIHGCARSLDALLDKLAPTPDDHLLFVGDYIDRGPDSKGVVDRLLALRQTHQCTFLRGNHEALMLDALDEMVAELRYADGPEAGLESHIDAEGFLPLSPVLLSSVRDYDAFRLWEINGGRATLESYADATGRLRLPMEHILFFVETQLFLDTDDFFFVHAGLKPFLTVAESIEQSSEEVFLWERSHLKAQRLSWEKTVVCGHTPQEKPLDHPQLINLDTGCVYYMHPRLGHLTAVRLPAREYVMVEYQG